MRHLRAPTRPLALAGVLASLAPAVIPAADPWDLLAQARDRLTTAPRTADFTQTFVPAGFASGESESGTVALALPDLLRWDYREPFPRTFLLQGETVFTWNEGETTGRRFPLEPEEADHLDLLRLDVGELSRSYRAVVAGESGTEVEVELQPAGGDHRLVDVRLTLRRSDLLPVGLAYRDPEGNATRFVFDEFRALAGSDVFLPPADIAWLEP